MRGASAPGPRFTNPAGGTARHSSHWCAVTNVVDNGTHSRLN
jgi:hypothetical protein